MDQPMSAPPNGPVPPPPAAVRTGKAGITPLILGGIAAAMAGLFLPWITAASPFGGRVDITGFATADGKLIVVGLVVLGWIAWRATSQPGRQLFTTALLGLLFVGLMVLADYRRVADWMGAANGGGFARIHPGAGLYLCGGGLSAGFAGVMGRLDELRGRPRF